MEQPANLIDLMSIVQHNKPKNYDRAQQLLSYHMVLPIVRHMIITSYCFKTHTFVSNRLYQDAKGEVPAAYKITDDWNGA